MLKMRFFKLFLEIEIVKLPNEPGLLQASLFKTTHIVEQTERMRSIQSAIFQAY